MPTQFDIDPTNVLTPSEMVYLHGEKFAKKVMIGNVELLHIPEKVSFAQLGQAMLASAFLANEQTGGIQFEIQQKKALMGLRKVKSLYAVPAKAIAWPDDSLEAQIGSIASGLQEDKGQNEISNIVYAWLREDSSSPWQAAIEKVKEGMAARGLLDKLEEKKLKIFSVTSYQLPQQTASLSGQIAIEPIQALLSECEKKRPEVWKMLVKQIESAIKARTEQTDSDFD